MRDCTINTLPELGRFPALFSQAERLIEDINILATQLLVLGENLQKRAFLPEKGVTDLVSKTRVFEKMALGLSCLLHKEIEKIERYRRQNSGEDLRGSVSSLYEFLDSLCYISKEMNNCVQTLMITSLRHDQKNLNFEEILKLCISVDQKVKNLQKIASENEASHTIGIQNFERKKSAPFF